MTDDEGLAPRKLSFAFDRRAVDERSVRAAGGAEVHAAAAQPHARMLTRDGRRVDDAVAGLGAPDDRFAVAGLVGARHAAFDEGQREQSPWRPDARSLFQACGGCVVRTA